MMINGPNLSQMPSEVARRDDESVRRAEAATPRKPRDQMRSRIKVALIAFALAYLVIAGRLVMFGLMQPVDGDGGPDTAIAAGRPDLVDRNGEILATDILRASVYAEPRNIIDADEATELLTSVLPDLDA